MRDMSPLEWALRPIKKYAVFSGRASRAEYWWFNLAAIIAGMATAVRNEFFGKTGAINGILNLALLLPSLAVLVRRLHDTDRSSWWLFILAVPVVIFVVPLAFGFTFDDDVLNSLIIGGLVGLAIVGSALIAAITLLIFTILPGTPGTNRYGPDPFGPDDDLEEVFA